MSMTLLIVCAVLVTVFAVFLLPQAEVVEFICVLFESLDNKALVVVACFLVGPALIICLPTTAWIVDEVLAPLSDWSSNAWLVRRGEDEEKEHRLPFEHAVIKDEGPMKIVDTAWPRQVETGEGRECQKGPSVPTPKLLSAIPNISPATPETTPTTPEMSPYDSNFPGAFSMLSESEWSDKAETPGESESGCEGSVAKGGDDRSDQTDGDEEGEGEGAEDEDEDEESESEDGSNVGSVAGESVVGFEPSIDSNAATSTMTNEGGVEGDETSGLQPGGAVLAPSGDEERPLSMISAGSPNPASTSVPVVAGVPTTTFDAPYTTETAQVVEQGAEAPVAGQDEPIANQQATNSDANVSPSVPISEARPTNIPGPQLFLVNNPWNAAMANPHTTSAQVTQYAGLQAGVRAMHGQGTPTVYQQYVRAPVVAQNIGYDPHSQWTEHMMATLRQMYVAVYGEPVNVATVEGGAPMQVEEPVAMDFEEQQPQMVAEQTMGPEVSPPSPSLAPAFAVTPELDTPMASPALAATGTVDTPMSSPVLAPIPRSAFTPSPTMDQSPVVPEVAMGSPILPVVGTIDAPMSSPVMEPIPQPVCDGIIPTLGPALAIPEAAIATPPPTRTFRGAAPRRRFNLPGRQPQYGAHIRPIKQGKALRKKRMRATPAAAAQDTSHISYYARIAWRTALESVFRRSFPDWEATGSAWRLEVPNVPASWGPPLSRPVALEMQQTPVPEIVPVAANVQQPQVVAGAVEPSTVEPDNDAPTAANPCGGSIDELAEMFAGVMDNFQSTRCSEAAEEGEGEQEEGGEEEDEEDEEDAEDGAGLEAQIEAELEGMDMAAAEAYLAKLEEEGVFGPAGTGL